MDYAYVRSSWWVFLVEALIEVGFGLLLLFYPTQAFSLVVLFFGIFALISGVIFTVGALANTKYEGWWLALLIGLVSLVVGIFLFVNPQVTATILLILIAVRAVIFGLVFMIGGWEVRKEVTGEWLVILLGIVSFIFGIWILFNLETAGEVVAIVLGVYLLFVGLLDLITAFKVRGLKAPEEMAA
jgi:uncharacterized membrane protein HdeD (DUF308 family)